MIAKLKDAIQAKQEAGCTQFIINARTDALKSIENRKEALKIAIDRANRYLETGADLCFVTYVTTLEEVRLLAREIAGPLSIAAGLPYNMGEFSVGDCCRLGIARVSLPNYVIFSALQAMLKGLKLIYETKDFSESVRGEFVFSDMRMLQDLLQQ
jgi:2-methylisocitrate lyase-like PEP mutase family enzyme